MACPLPLVSAIAGLSEPQSALRLIGTPLTATPPAFALIDTEVVAPAARLWEPKVKASRLTAVAATAKSKVVLKDVVPTVTVALAVAAPTATALLELMPTVAIPSAPVKAESACKDAKVGPAVTAKVTRTPAIGLPSPFL